MGYAADSLTIDEVMEPGSCARHDAATLIGDDYAALIRLRNEIEDAIAAGTPKLVCPICGAPVYLRCGFRHKSDARLSEDFHFWHGPGESKCPLSQTSRLSRKEILAAKYHGQREGQAHIRLKHLVHDSLCSDPRFTDVAIERTWRLEGDPRQWRRPDVSSCFQGVPVVFEIQLSTTFVSVMAERRHFYRERGALLVWIVADFDPAWAALAHEDIFYPNNRNIFVASERTLAASRQTQAFTLDAHWFEPYDAGKALPGFHFRHGLVDFGDLTRDIARQRTFHFDTDAAEERVKRVLADAPLRDAFERHWFSYLRGAKSRTEVIRHEREWDDLRQRFQQRGIALPDNHYEVAPLLNSVYSARDIQTDQLVGWRYKNLLELAHHLYAQHKSVLWPYRLALQAFDRGPMMRELDTKEQWRRKKVPRYLLAIANDDPIYRPPGCAASLLAVLFPAMADALSMSPREFLAREQGRSLSR